MKRLVSTFGRFAAGVSTLSLAAVFCLFIVGVGLRYLFDKPVSWIDEAVTVLTVWSVLWTGAFRLRWSEHIAFDILFVSASAKTQRAMLLVVCTAFVLLMSAAMPAMTDYTLFLWRERTDMLEMRLDFVYAIFPVFFAVIIIRLIASIAGLVGRNWRPEVTQWGGRTDKEQP